MGSNTLSIIAVTISLISAVIAVWSAWTNHQSLKFTKFNREMDRRLQHTKACSELMEEIRVYENGFQSELKETQELELHFESLLIQSSSSFVRYVPIFNVYKPKLEGFLLQTRLLWDETYEWYAKYRYDGYAAHDAHFRRLLLDDKKIKNEWSSLIKELRKHINGNAPIQESR